MNKKPKNKDPLSEKEVPKATVSKDVKKLNKYFENQLTMAALEAFDRKDYMKATMLTWSFIEEYFLPVSIKHVAKHQKIKLEKEFLLNKPAYHLIRYYYLISYDTTMYEALEKARQLRNKAVHQIFETNSIAAIDERAKESATYNLRDVYELMLDRLDGAYIPPSLQIYTNARNDLRNEIKANFLGDL